MRTDPALNLGSLLVTRDSGRTKLREEGRCRMCERPSSIRRLSRHHVVPQEWFRPLWENETSWARRKWWILVRDSENNVVPLCEPCHRLVEEDEDSRRMLRKALAAQEAAFAVRLRGHIWFDRRYPRDAAHSLIAYPDERHDVVAPPGRPLRMTGRRWEPPPAVRFPT